MKPDYSTFVDESSIDAYMIPDVSTETNQILKNSIITPDQIPLIRDLQFFREADSKYFSKLLSNPDLSIDLSIDEQKELRLMGLLLKIKNGNPSVRKQGLRSLTDNARNFGPKILFNQILPLLMEKDFEDQERHLIVKVIDRILYKLDDLVRPYTHRILKVISPLLMEEDYIARNEGREIISNLSKAAGLNHMITTLRPDIDSSDDYVRNKTARTFAVIANALGILSLIPFLKAVCQSKKSWQARLSGVKIIQQITVLLGCGVLPQLDELVGCIHQNLNHEILSIRRNTALALSSLADASAPYGIESFEKVLDPLWNGVQRQRGPCLCAFLKCIGCLIPLMDSEYANYYAIEVIKIILREINSSDEEMKRTILKVIQQCADTDGVTASFLVQKVVLPFFRNFWNRRIALDHRSSKMVIQTTHSLARKIGFSELVNKLIDILKDDSDSFRKMGAECIQNVISSLGTSDLSDRTVERLIDGLLVSFELQVTFDDQIILKSFGTTISSLDVRVKPFISKIVSIILYRLRNNQPQVRQLAADLITKVSSVIINCGEEDIMYKLGKVLYESLGEVYPDVLGSILNALENIISVVGLASMNPPIEQLLPNLTPILRNRHEKVQESTIKLIGRIADRGPEYIPSKEWMRICFELIDMLKAHRKSIRRAANNTFGYIAKAIGPQEVLSTLLNNLKVQERQSRVCTAVAIGIVAETCEPFTVLPALMNEYRTPENNVQNGVLKAMTFMFEYIGGITKDYVYAVAPLVADALTDRDQVHRQTAATVVKHMALGCIGTGCEDAFINFLNLLIPNIYETSPQVIDRVIDGIDAIRNNVGSGIVLNYIFSGIFQAARKVRAPYWKIYNDCYIQSCDSMVPYYPDFQEKHYKIEELDDWI
ncbi:U2 snRNP complex subunit HSH155 [Ascoidea rubescens DSM 1968]|uniref:ARM repeat-containing protein n=1 Tax=Ascoidea rubescens DSM 1968 TaxID=1344418 RepID=A0A1D2VCZ8_9ASCO|nr:ARM repeat-containing protein [Ascoidea rubescens DSM 1968]ODV59506.1 ARM repeat-containing protein [Ascoidea rubescens DSM 1968]